MALGLSSLSLTSSCLSLYFPSGLVTIANLHLADCPFLRILALMTGRPLPHTNYSVLPTAVTLAATWPFDSLTPICPKMTLDVLAKASIYQGDTWKCLAPQFHVASSRQGAPKPHHHTTVSATPRSIYSPRSVLQPYFSSNVLTPCVAGTNKTTAHTASGFLSSFPAPAPGSVSVSCPALLYQACQP